MSEKTIVTPEYKQWLTEIKNKVRAAQLKAATVVNSALIEFYWDLGKMIVQKQKQTSWGDKVIDQLSKDLQKEFTDIKGLSRRNLYYTKQFYLFYEGSIGQQDVDLISHQHGGEIFQQPVGKFVQQLVAQIPWGHNILNRN